MPANPRGHRLAGEVLEAEIKRQPVLAKLEMLLRAVGPWPGVGGMHIAQHGPVSRDSHGIPFCQPGVPVDGMRLGREVRIKLHRASPPVEPSVSDTTGKREQRKCRHIGRRAARCGSQEVSALMAEEGY